MLRSANLVLHDHGQWLAINRFSAQLAREKQIPRVVSPRGMLTPWALSQKKLKKKLAWWLYARRDLDQACVIHATSQLELSELRELGVRRPIAMIPNGVELPPIETRAKTPGRKPFVLFLSRIHEKKGIRELLECWRSLAPRDWELVLAGPDEQGILSKSLLPSGTTYVGPVDGVPKQQLMQSASLFVLPTHSENFGVVVAESLSAGVPVITTHAAPWSCLAENQCGWWVPMNVDSIRETLLVAMRTPSEELEAMGMRGRELVKAQFSWPGIVGQMLEVYRWILGESDTPECVQSE
jgi:glycosyltransferase involved in cell wall biosynthesis